MLEACPRLSGTFGGTVSSFAAVSTTALVESETMTTACSATPIYPPIEPYRTGRLPVDAVHTLYWEECGNPNGVSVLFLHGGPGSGLSPQHRQFFDPSYYRIVLFDQRGAGQSTPLGEYRDNTTPLLIADIERLRALMGIEGTPINS